MIENIIWLIAGAAIQPVTSEAWRGCQAAVRRFRQTRRVARDRKLAPAALDWFQRNGFAANLYTPGHVNEGRPIPMVYDSAADLTGPVRPLEDDYLTLGSTVCREFNVSQGAVRRRERAGAELWDGKVLYAEETDLKPDGDSSLTLGVCNFYSYVTAADRIQIAFSESSKPENTRFLAEHLSDFGRAVAPGHEPVCVAAAATCLFETAAGPRILLSERAEEVVNALGSYCVIPTFGFESSAVEGVKSQYGLIFYNFLKEFLEEVYGLEKAIRWATSESLDPDALFALKDVADDAKRLLAEFTSGRADLYVTGMGIEATDGTITLALLAHFRSPEFHREVLRTAKAGWEIKRSRGRQPIEFVAPDTARMTELTRLEAMSATSLFSIDSALRHLRD